MICQAPECAALRDAGLVSIEEVRRRPRDFDAVAERFSCRRAALRLHVGHATEPEQGGRSWSSVTLDPRAPRGEQLAALLSEAAALLRSDDEAVRVKAIERATKLVELAARLAGELRPEAMVAVQVNVEPPPVDVAAVAERLRRLLE